MGSKGGVEVGRAATGRVDQTRKQLPASYCIRVQTAKEAPAAAVNMPTKAVKVDRERECYVTVWIPHGK